MQRTDDVQQGLVHFIHLWDKKSCLSVQRTGYGKKGLLHFIHLWDKITFI